MVEPIDMILPLLREMRAENSMMHAQIYERVRLLEEGLNALLDSVQASFETRPDGRSSG